MWYYQKKWNDVQSVYILYVCPVTYCMLLKFNKMLLGCCFLGKMALGQGYRFIFSLRLSFFQWSITTRPLSVTMCSWILNYHLIRVFLQSYGKEHYYILQRAWKKGTMLRLLWKMRHLLNLRMANTTIT